MVGYRMERGFLLSWLIKILIFRGGSLASMAPPRMGEMRNFELSSTILVIWLTDRGMLAGTTMRFFTQRIETRLLSPLVNRPIFMPRYPNSL